MLLRGALLALMAVAWTSSVSALCVGGYWTDCYYNAPSCNGGFYRSGQTCHWGGGDCPSLCGWAWEDHYECCPNPTPSPTNFPTPLPSAYPTTRTPTTAAPTSPTAMPTSSPSLRPSMSPTPPTGSPSEAPTPAPTRQPTRQPTTEAPTSARPTNAPTASLIKAAAEREPSRNTPVYVGVGVGAVLLLGAGALVLSKGLRRRGEQSTAVAVAAGKPCRVRATGGSSSGDENPASLESGFEGNCVVKFPFRGQASDELTCTNGERLRVIRMVDASWALADNARGEQGIVPVHNLRLDLDALRGGAL